MPNEIRINISEQIGNNSAVLLEDGEKLYNCIMQNLIGKEGVIVLDFTNIELITPTFLNTAIGQLYSQFNSPFLRERLRLDNIVKDDLELLKTVIKNSKEYFSQITNNQNIPYDKFLDSIFNGLNIDINCRKTITEWISIILENSLDERKIRGFIISNKKFCK